VSWKENTDQGAPIAATLAAFPSNVVEQMRARIRRESRIQREQIETNVKELDATQQAQRQEASQRNATETRASLRCRKTPSQTTVATEETSIAATLAALPLDAVEEMRARVESEAQTQREQIKANVKALDATQQAQRQEASQRKAAQTTASRRPWTIVTQTWTRPKLLEEEHNEIMAAGVAFLPTITPSTLRKCAKDYYHIRVCVQATAGY